mmetsp:Transcript_29680/g.95132  ORF Transcript_29680/g.95132 Transcript_29680/m.95132 type:complete len:82 (+) Transcript_29680:336-581(+)
MLLLGARTWQALSRFWDGTGLLHMMRGEWYDSVSCLVAFSRSAKATRPAEVLEFRHTLVRLMRCRVLIPLRVQSVLSWDFD